MSFVASTEVITASQPITGERFLTTFGARYNFKTVKPAIRLARQNQDASDEQGEGLTWLVVETDFGFSVVRDWHDSDFGRFQQIVR